MSAQRSSPLRKAFLSGRGALYLFPWLAHLLLADIALSALLPVFFFFPNVCYDISSHIAASVWRGIQLIFTRVNRADIIISGLDKLPRDESAIVVSNHVQWTDFYMIQELAIRSGMLGRCRWFAKKELRWVPFLGWGLWAMNMPLVSRNWMSDQREIDQVFRGVLERKWPIWLISYSEGTRYTQSKRLEAEAWCRDRKKQMPQHLLFPRTKGFVACVQNLRKTTHVKAVYDITVAYVKKEEVLFQQPPTFVQSVSLPGLDQKWSFFVHVERHLLKELPNTDDEVAQWLEDRWIEKGERLENLRQRVQKGLSWDSF